MFQQRIETRIEIGAPAARVWSLLTDFRRMPSWNPFIRAISGDLAEGARLRAKIALEGKSPMRFAPVVETLRPERELRWRGSLFVRGLFDGEHYFRLEPLDETRTCFEHGEIFSGLLVPLLGPMLPATRKGFEAMNRALAEQAETIHDS
jgi:hypothetical protein